MLLLIKDGWQPTAPGAKRHQPRIEYPLWPSFIPPSQDFFQGGTMFFFESLLSDVQKMEKQQKKHSNIKLYFLKNYFLI